MCRSCAEKYGNVLASVALAMLAACSSTPSQDKAIATARQASAAPAPAEPLPPMPPPIPPEATQKFERALTLLSSGDLTQAESELQRLSASYPDYSGPLVNLGVIYLKNGRLADAEKALRAATERSPQNAAAFNQLGIVYRNLGRFKDADAAYRRAIEADGNYALAHLNLGVLCDLYLQQPDRALTAFERYQSLSSKPDPKVATWVKELRSRLGVKAPEVPATSAATSAVSSPPSEGAKPQAGGAE